MAKEKPEVQELSLAACDGTSTPAPDTLIGQLLDPLSPSTAARPIPARPSSRV